MKFPWTCVVTLSLLIGNIVAYGNPLLEKSTLNNNSPSTVSETLIQQRLKNINSPIRIQYDPVVTEYVKGYVIQGQRETQRILGRTALYFPIFEHYLKSYRLPEQLKYLPIIESRLYPTAKSSAGASGLWQFTAATARQFHLTINGNVDERRDPIRSTEAAVSYLSQLYAKYHDWALVLAAYNCGPARLNQAIRTAGVKDYWKVRQFLPKETQDYVPRFLAATYLMHHYQDHRLIPSYPSHQMQLTQTVKLFQGVSFQDIARETGVSIEMIKALNPGYWKSYIPTSEQGHYLILPAAAMSDYKQINAKQLVAVNFSGNKKMHLVQAGDTIESLAKRFQCSVKDIQYWNNLKQDQLFFRQELVIYTNGESVGARS